MTARHRGLGELELPQPMAHTDQPSDQQPLVQGDVTDPGPPARTDQRLMYTVVAVAALGGFQFGLDTGVISGALPYIRDDLLSHVQDPTRLSTLQGLIVSAAIMAAVVGSSCGGALSDRLGRKSALLVADVLFILGAFCMGLAPSAAVLIMGRVLVGLGVGLASCVAPVFIAECARQDVRAALVTFNVFAITGGQFVAYVSDWALACVPGTWRWMLGVAAVPALLQLLGLLALPESPRWLAAHGQEQAAKAVAVRLHGSSADSLLGRARCASTDSEPEPEPETDLEPAPAKQALSQLWQPPLRRQLLLGIGLQVLQQAAGINTVMYFTPSILQLAGVGSKRDALLVALLPAGVNALGTVVALFTVERYGRRAADSRWFRRLLLISAAGVTAALALLAGTFWLSEAASPAVVPGPQDAAGSCGAVPVDTCFQCLKQGCTFCGPTGQAAASGFCVPSSGSCPAQPPAQAYAEGCPSRYTAAILIALLLYLLAFSPGLGSVPWAVNSELFTPEVRGLGNGLAATANWLTNAVVSLTFLPATKQLGASTTFGIYALLAAAGGAWLSRALPETKGLSLEQIQQLFA